MKEKISRQEEIIRILKETEKPVSGTDLAKMLGVTRQVIVQDIALLKAHRYEIISTNRGYRINDEDKLSDKAKRIIKVNHEDSDIEKELNIIVDKGAVCLDVFVWHKAYGKIQAPLNVRSRRDIKTLIDNINAGISKPLKKLTENYHYHTLVAEDEEILNEIEEELKSLNFLLPMDMP